MARKWNYDTLTWRTALLYKYVLICEGEVEGEDVDLPIGICDVLMTNVAYLDFHPTCSGLDILDLTSAVSLAYLDKGSPRPVG